MGVSGLAAAVGVLSLISSIVLAVSLYSEMRAFFKPVPNTGETSRVKASRVVRSFETSLYWVSIADAITAFGWVLSAWEPGKNGGNFGLCVFQGVLIDFGTIASACLTASLSWEMYRGIVWLHEELAGPQLAWIRHKWHLGVSLGSSVFLTTLAGSLGEIGSVWGPWCWVKGGPSHPVAPVFLTYLPLLLCLLFLLGVYGMLGLHIWRLRSRSGSVATVRSRLLQVGIYPVAFFIVWIIPLIVRIAESRERSIPELAVVTALFAPSQGLINLAVFSSTSPRVRQAIRNAAALAGCSGRTAQLLARRAAESTDTEALVNSNTEDSEPSSKMPLGAPSATAEPNTFESDDDDDSQHWIGTEGVTKGEDALTLE